MNVAGREIFASGAVSFRAMCRNIRVLHDFEPPTTEEEIRAAALQYVRKVSGMQSHASFDAAVEEIASVTTRLLAQLPHRRERRTREGERVKARLRWEKRSIAGAR
jgi:hypothetical protein